MHSHPGTRVRNFSRHYLSQIQAFNDWFVLQVVKSRTLNEHARCLRDASGDLRSPFSTLVPAANVIFDVGLQPLTGC